MLADIKWPHLDFWGAPTAFHTALLAMYLEYELRFENFCIEANSRGAAFSHTCGQI